MLLKLDKVWKELLLLRALVCQLLQSTNEGGLFGVFVSLTMQSALAKARPVLMMIPRQRPDVLLGFINHGMPPWLGAVALRLSQRVAWTRRPALAGDIGRKFIRSGTEVQVQFAK